MKLLSITLSFWDIFWLNYIQPLTINSWFATSFSFSYCHSVSVELFVKCKATCCKVTIWALFFLRIYWSYWTAAKAFLNLNSTSFWWARYPRFKSTAKLCPSFSPCTASPAESLTLTLSSPFRLFPCVWLGGRHSWAGQKEDIAVTDKQGYTFSISLGILTAFSSSVNYNASGWEIRSLYATLW